ncbi:MAG TPA: hypothetical protein VFV38_37750 [Ktedonobacteraceae bacterium]|nr:hypothetical protein [Ktedonobacteraceae bacterium]
MTTSRQTATFLPVTVPFSEHLSETWLIERTSHAQLRNGRELSVPDLTLAMKRLTDFDVPLLLQSSKSHLAERVPLKKSTIFSVPFSTWREISQTEAQTLSQQGIPILLYGEHAWERPQGASRTWSANKNMRVIIFGSAGVQPEAISGTDYAVCYLDPQRGTFSNSVWKARFASDTATLLAGGDHSTITFFRPSVQFPFTTHYTVIAADGQVHEYATSMEAIQDFQTLPPRRMSSGSQVQTIFPQFCYYHEVTCPSGVYRLEFFGPRMDERGYRVKETI